MAIDSDPGLRIESEGDALIIRQNTSGFHWLGAILAGMGCIAFIFLLLSIGRPMTINGHMVLLGSSEYSADAWLIRGTVTILAILFIVDSVLPGGPRVTTTAFNLRSREVIQSKSVWNRPPRSYRYAFDDLAGIYLGEDGEGARCKPHIRLKARVRVLTLVHMRISIPAGWRIVWRYWICQPAGI